MTACNDVSLAEEKTPRAAIAATVGLAAATISDAKSSAAIPTATWEDMPVSIVEGDATSPERVLVTGDEHVSDAYKGIFDRTSIVPLELSHYLLVRTKI